MSAIGISAVETTPRRRSAPRSAICFMVLQVPIAMSLRWKLWKLCARSACRRLSSVIRWTTVCLVARARGVGSGSGPSG
jgi:hypothetical protein